MKYDHLLLFLTVNTSFHINIVELTSTSGVPDRIHGYLREKACLVKELTTD